MENKFKCTCKLIDEEKVIKINKIMPNEETVLNTADFLKMFSDSTRLKILLALSSESLCVCDIANVCNMTHSAVSHQLRSLKGARLVKGKKVGKTVYYRLDDDHIKEIIDVAINHIKEETI